MDFSLEQVIASFSSWSWDRRRVDSIESIEEEVFGIKVKEDFVIFDADKPWVSLDPKIFFDDLDDEIEGRW